MTTRQPPRIQALAMARRLGMLAGSLLGVGLLLLWLAGVFHRKVPEDAATPEGGEPLAGRVSVAARIVERPQFESAVGTVRPVHEVALAAKLLAKVEHVDVRAGQLVDAGQLLVKLDEAALQARYKQAEATRDAAQANQQRTAADQKRAERLIASKAISQAEYDAAVAAARSADAEVERARQAVDEARILLSYTEIRSPLTGTIVDKRVEAGDTVAPGQVLLTLYDPKHMQMVAVVRESLASQLRVGQQVPARLESMGYDCEATISEIVPEANVASRSFQVKVTGPCPPGVYSGMFGRLLIPTGTEKLLVIPAAAVRRVGQLTLVDVVENGQLRRRSVQLGRTLDTDVEILAGLAAAELVVVDPAAAREST